MLTRLSSAVLKVNAANADPNRYTFLTLQNAEPSLGIPAGDNYVLTSNVNGQRTFAQIGTLLTGGYGIDVFSNGLIQLDPEIDFNLSNANIVASGVARFDYTTLNPTGTLSGNDNNGNSLQFDANDTVLVYVDGFLLLETEDYSYDIGANSKVILTANTFANSIVSIVRFSPTLFVSGTGGTSNANATIGTIYASNVIENGNTTSGNVFFTNARAIGAFIAGSGIGISANGMITSAAAFTGNTNSVPEGSANLYFTNARAISAVANNITTTSVTEGINLYFTNARALSAVQNNITTTSVAEGANLYFTNSRVVSAISAGKDITIDANGRINSTLTVGTLPTIFASNVIENGNTTTGNVFFTNTRARAAFTAGQNIYIESNGMIISSATFSSLPTIFASNVVENGNTTTGNVFFTNARALSAVQNNITTTSVAEGTNLYFTTQRARDSISAGPGINYDNLTGTVYIGTLYTANVTESASNLYFTNARAISAFTAGQNIGIDANGRISANVSVGGLPTIYTSNVNESGDTTSGNVYFTNARARQAFTFGQGLTFNGITGSLVANVRSVNGLTGAIVLNSDSINEGSSNLYYTNARARSSISAGDTTIIYDQANGTIKANITATVVQGSVDGIANTATLVVGNLIPSSPGERDLGNATHPWRDLWLTGSTIRLGNLVLKDINGKFTVSNANANIITPAFTTAQVPEVASNLYFTNTRAISAVQNNITTTSVAEGTNLYFTTARARSSISAGTGIVYDTSNGIVSLSTIDGGGLAVSILASNVIENGTTTTGNVFFTNNRARAAFTAGAGIGINAGIITANVRSVNGATGIIVLDTDDISEGTSNLYFTNARARAAFSNGTGISIDANGVISSAALPSSNVVVGTYGNSSFVGQFTVSANGLITAANNIAITYPVLSVAGKTGAVTLTTANVSEDGSLYFTNARSVSAFTAGNGINIASNGLITANVISATNNTIRTTISVSNVTAVNTIGYGSIGYDSANGIITYNKVTNVNVVSALSAGTGINIESNGRISATITTFYDNSNTRSAISVANTGTGFGTIDYSNTTGIITYTRVTNTNIRSAISVANVGTGYGSVDYDSTNGIITYNKVTNSNIRSALSAGTGIAIDANGVITANVTTSYGDSNTRSALSVSNVGVGFGTLDYNNSTGLFTFNRITNANIRSAITATNTVAGHGNLSYNESTGALTFTRVSDANIRLALSGGSGITYNNISGVISLSQTLDTTSNVQFRSFGVGTAPSGVAGEIRATNDITAFYSSDRRLKSNIVTIANALDIISKFEGVYFDWNDDYIEERGGEDNFFVRKHDLGFIADKLQTAIPEVVGRRPDGYLGVRYEKVVPVLTQAIKELVEEINILKTQIKNITSEK